MGEIMPPCEIKDTQQQQQQQQQQETLAIYNTLPLDRFGCGILLLLSKLPLKLAWQQCFLRQNDRSVTCSLQVIQTS